MKKGIEMRAQIVVANTPAATGDPAQIGPGLATQILTAGIQAGTDPFTVTLKKPATLVAGTSSTSAPPHPRNATTSAQLYIEGDVAPALDFAKVGQSVVSRIFSAGSQTYTGPFTLTLTGVDALEGSDDDDSDDSDAG